MYFSQDPFADHKIMVRIIEYLFYTPCLLQRIVNYNKMFLGIVFKYSCLEFKVGFYLNFSSGLGNPVPDQT